MTIEDIKREGSVILECISGSRAYGLDTATSDTDIKGVFVLPKKTFYGLDYIPQVSNATNDIVFYELGRFMELLSVNNPNIMELLSTPKPSVIHKDNVLDQIDPTRILSKQFKNTFGKYALSQIKKARGLKKKVLNPMDKERKSPLSFCYISQSGSSEGLHHFLERHNWKQQDCGLKSLPNMKNVYGLYHGPEKNYYGLIRNENSNDLSLSTIPEGEPLSAILYFNQEGYSSYCRDYTNYWDWVENRNEERYKNTESSGRQYDAKNMMHTFRLLNMAIEIGREGRINVQRKDRDFLLAVKSGRYEFEELIEMADKKQTEMEEAFRGSTLADKPDRDYINEITYYMRNEWYAGQ